MPGDIQVTQSLRVADRRKASRLFLSIRKPTYSARVALTRLQSNLRNIVIFSKTILYYGLVSPSGYLCVTHVMASITGVSSFAGNLRPLLLTGLDLSKGESGRQGGCETGEGKGFLSYCPIALPRGAGVSL